MTGPLSSVFGSVAAGVSACRRAAALAVTVAVLFACALHTCGAEPNATFDRANRLYEQGRFAEAAAAYESLVQSGTVSPAIYFNLGNARFKSGAMGRALEAYRKAEQLAPRDPDLRANLEFLRSHLQGPTLEPGIIERTLKRLTIDEWTAAATGALWLCLVLLAATQLRPALSRPLRAVTWLSGLMAVVLGICLASALASASAPRAIVTAAEAVVRNGPLEESPDAFTVRDGAELNVLDEKGAWLQVSVGNRVGWIERGRVLWAGN